jgi:hypothetical protein
VIHGNRHLLDLLIWICAGIAAVSLSQLAFLATALAGFGSFVLFLIRVFDRIKYGPQRGRE